MNRARMPQQRTSMSSQRSTRSSSGSNKRSSLSLHNETYDGDDNEAEQEEEGRSDSKRRRYTQPDEDEGEEEEEKQPHSGPHRRSQNGVYSHSQPAPAAFTHPPPATHANANDDEIEFAYEGDETATQASQQQQHASKSQSSLQQPADAASLASYAGPDVDLPEENVSWLQGYAVMQEDTAGRRRRPLEQQNREHRTQIRQLYGEMIHQSSGITPDQLKNNQTALQMAVAMADRIHARVSHVTEEIQDAEELRTLAGKGYDKAKLFLQHDDIVNVEQMIAALHQRFDNADAKEDVGAIDWVRMGERTMPLSLNAPVTSFMRGVLNQHIAHKERKRTQGRQHDEELVTSTATTLDSAEQLVDKQTHMRQLHVLRHFKRLTRNGQRAVWLYELLVDPHSFVRTVENFFDFSFLVKGNVRMEWEEWDSEMAFPMVRWRRSEQERTRERKRMERRLRRLKQRIAARQEAGEPGEDETAADAERREREDRQCERLVALLRSLNDLPPTQRRLTQSQAQSAAAEHRRQAATDESEANVAHFTPTLDYHAWSAIVIKFGLREARIPPMTGEEERRLRERMDRRAKRKKGKEAKVEEEEEEEEEEQEEEKEEEADGGEEEEDEEANEDDE